MQVKTIKKVITNKLNEWLETIEDTDLRIQVKKNLLVSGGSITSLFQGIPVNDYDIYIKDMDVLIRLAKYYCAENIVLDGRERQSIIEEFCKENYGSYNEYDFSQNQSQSAVRLKTLKQDQVKLNIASEGMKITPTDKEKTYQVVFLSQNAISLSDDIQIVLRFHGDSTQIHKTFDFIHATNYFTFAEGLVTNIEALQCILTKSLKYQGSLYPLTSIIRMKKFINRGWTINAGEMLKIMFQISELDLKNIEILEEQLIGVDVAYFAALIALLRGEQELSLTSTRLNELIDRVFEYTNEEQ